VLLRADNAEDRAGIKRRSTIKRASMHVLETAEVAGEPSPAPEPEPEPSRTRGRRGG
jgi:hypothetical protein